MTVDSIYNGVVIDHITAGHGMRLYTLLHLDVLDCPVAIMKNVVSPKMGRKDMIKIDGEIDLNLDVVGFSEPGATINTIRGGVLIDKRKIDMPELLYNVVQCKNPRCITSTEQELAHVFRLTDRENKIYRCIYCETQAKLDK